MTFKIGQVVYFRNRRAEHPGAFRITEGPYRTLDLPGVDQYAMKNYLGSQKVAPGQDLMTEAEYKASLKGEE